MKKIAPKRKLRINKLKKQKAPREESKIGDLNKYFLQIGTLFEQEKYVAALELLNKVIDKKPKPIEASYIMKADLLTRLERYEEAIGVCDKVLEIDQKHIASYNPEVNALYPIAYNLKAKSLLSLNRNEEAIEMFDKEIALSPNAWDAYFGKGRALSDLKRNTEAVLCYDKALELNPTNHYISMYRAVAIKLSGNICFEAQPI